MTRAALVRLEPDLIEEDGDVLRLVFEGHGVNFYTWRDRSCVIADEYGVALGYAPKVVSGQIRRTWADELVVGRDYDILSGEELREFKALLEQVVSGTTSSNARSLMILYESGADAVALLSAKPKGRRLRRVVVERVMPRLRRGEVVSLKPTAAPALDPILVKALVEQASSDTVAKLSAALEEDRRAHATEVASMREELEAMRRDVKAVNDVVTPYAQHPERFLPLQQLGDDPDQRAKVRDLIQKVMATQRVSFQRIEGLLRSRFKVTGYTTLHFTQVQAARELLLDLSTGQLPPRARVPRVRPPLPPADPRQTVLPLDAFRKRKGKP